MIHVATNATIHTFGYLVLNDMISFCSDWSKEPIYKDSFWSPILGAIGVGVMTYSLPRVQHVRRSLKTLGFNQDTQNLIHLIIQFALPFFASMTGAIVLRKLGVSGISSNRVAYYTALDISLFILDHLSFYSWEELKAIIFRA